MPDPKQLPYILSLLDDESEVVRAGIGRELNAYGDALKTELARLSAPLDLKQRRQIQDLMQEYSREWLGRHWNEWMQEEGEVLGLERAFAVFSEYLSGFIFPTDLSILLDDLAAKCRKKHPVPTAKDLAHFLFKDLGIKGAQHDYGNPLHLSLVHVVREKRGIPLSLAGVYILTGARLGLHIEGCNFPGHFLARVVEDGEVSLVDCYNGGAQVDHKVVAQMSEQTPWGVQNLIQYPAPTRAIVARTIGNLVKSFDEMGRPEDVKMMLSLSEAMEKDSSSRQGAQPPASGAAELLRNQPRFRTGDVVAAPKLGWRGVIVDFDLSCKAPEAWYLAHGAGSRKAQPWYHIFIDGSQQVGYAAEESLMTDLSGEKVYHPLVPHFFEKYENGRFWRNTRAWPGTL